jgi:hypothetical protein
VPSAGTAPAEQAAFAAPSLAVSAMRPTAVVIVTAVIVAAPATVVFVKSEHLMGSFRSHGAKIYLQKAYARLERYIF